MTPPSQGVCRGQPFKLEATTSRSSGVYNDKSAPRGKYWRNKPSVFSLLPRIQVE